MKSSKSFFLFLILCCLLASCHNTKTSETTETATEEEHQNELELPFPEPPAALSTPEERAAYILLHFWDELDFSDTVKSHNVEFIEQNFSNFISLFPYTDESGLTKAVNYLITRAEKDSIAYSLILETADKYLYDPNSPMLNEDFYIFFLQEFLNSSATGERAKIRLEQQLKDTRKNRPGMIASNFSYKDRKGKATTLYKTQFNNDLILIFYDPDCNHCDEAINLLLEDDALKELLEQKQLSVMAIYSGDKEALWKKTNIKFPDEWIVGYENGKIDDEEIYVLRATPTIFLLDKDKRIVLKDVPVNTLLALLHQSYD